MQRIYTEDVLTANFSDTKIDFDFNANQIIIGAVSGDIEISFDGIVVHGKIKTTDGLVPFPDIGVSKIWLRGNTFTSRIFAWV